MNKCIIIPDSYKGTLSAIEICDIMKNVIVHHYPDCQTIAVPVADGGEGTVDCFLYALNAEKVTVAATGPYGEPLTAYYARIKNKAVIETASTAGLPLVEGRLNPCKTTTYGLGALIHHAVNSGCDEIVIGLGGSCTNDGGTGVARALGTIFYNQNNEEFIPAGDTLTEISRIDCSKTKDFLKGCKITAMCDIDNPMYGEHGAAYIFSPQKGADASTVELLDRNLRSLAKVIENSIGKDVSSLKGAGAAGALGAGIVAFMDGELKSGIDTILDLIEFDQMLSGTDMVFTGEGRFDSQSLRGKVVIGVAKRAMEQNVPVTVVAGSIGDDIDDAYDRGIHAIFSINRTAMDFDKSRYLSDKNLEHSMNDIIRFYKTVEGNRK